MPARGRKREKLVGLSNDDDDDDSPSPPLLPEAQSPLVQQATVSLRRSADLLNAARVYKPVETACSPSNDGSRSVQIQSVKFIGQKKSCDGRLKHPSILRADLVKIGTANAIRTSVYELPGSPEKTIASTHALEETKVQKRKRGRPRKHPIKPPLPVPPTHDPSAPVVPEAQDFEGVETAKATYKPSILTGSPEKLHRMRKSGRLAGKKADLSAVNWEKRPESIIARSSDISRSVPKRKASSEAANGTPNKSPRKETNLAKRPRGLEELIQEVQSYPVVVIPSPLAAAHVQKSKPSPLNKVNVGADSQAHLFGDAPDGADTTPDLIEESPGHGSEQAHADGTPVSSLPPSISKTTIQQSKRTVETGRSPQLEIRQKQTPAASPSRSGLGEGDVEAVMVRAGSETGSPAIAVPNTRDKNNKGDPQNPLSADVIQVDERAGVRGGSRQVIVSDMENERDEDYHTAEEDGTPDEEIADVHHKGLADLDIVFAFGHHEDREGLCQSKSARRIKALCSELLDSLSVPDITMADVEEVCGQARAALEKAHTVEVDTRQAFKEDAFAHLFWTFARILEAVYDWYTEQFDDPTTSLKALKVIVPFMKEILSFKGTVTSWKVKVSQRSIGDGIVKDVQQNFIAPLRRVAKEHSRALANLARAEAARKAQEAARARHEQDEKARARKAAYAEDLRLRRERWRRLHIHRMKCEPSMNEQRLRHLKYISFENLEERDANGIPFQREEVFEHRPIPHAFKQLQAKRRPWTDAEMEALLEGLQKYAGPSVFESIFEKYCRPGGPLRDFNVMEITAEAEHHRTCLLESFDDNDWEVPEWIKMIPVLP